MKELTGVRIVDQILYKVPEHEVLVSFNDDVDAVMFQDWLHTEGFGHFAAWRVRYEQDYR